MRWVAAITACLLLGIVGAKMSTVGSTPDLAPIDQEVEATLDQPLEVAPPITAGPLAAH